MRNTPVEAVDGKIEAVRIAGAGALVTIWGMTLNEWAAIAALAYTGAQFILLLPRVVRQICDWVKWVRDVFKG